MNRLAAVFLVTMLALVASAPAYAQATRSWVSGVGDDANPCSRTAPCKTYAGAISKTAAGGEISVLDPGGFGAVTISKAMTLEGDGDLASTTFSGTNAVNVVAGINDVVVLRNNSRALTSTPANTWTLAGKAFSIIHPPDLRLE